MVIQENAADIFDALFRDAQARCLSCNHMVQLAIMDMQESLRISFRRLRSIAKQFPEAMSEERSIALSEVNNIIKGFHPHPGKWNGGLFGVPLDLE